MCLDNSLLSVISIGQRRYRLLLEVDFLESQCPWRLPSQSPPRMIQNKGGISKIRPLSLSRGSESTGGPLIAVNSGGEETWDRIQSSLSVKPLVILNNAYSTTYGLGNQRGYEEAYYLKRISKGWILRTFPGPWRAFLEKPDGTCELIQTYKEKPALNEVAKLVREESFKRFAIGNDRWTQGFGGRL